MLLSFKQLGKYREHIGNYRDSFPSVSLKEMRCVLILFAKTFFRGSYRCFRPFRDSYPVLKGRFKGHEL